jgi:hypothetical protein
MRDDQLESFRYSEKVDERGQEEESRYRQEQDAERTGRYVDGISTGDYPSYLRSLAPDLGVRAALPRGRARKR